MQLRVETKKTKTKKVSEVPKMADVKIYWGLKHGEFLVGEIADFLIYSKRPISELELDGIQRLILFTPLFSVFFAGEEYRRWREVYLEKVI